MADIYDRWKKLSEKRVPADLVGVEAILKADVNSAKALCLIDVASLRFRIRRNVFRGLGERPLERDIAGALKRQSTVT